MIPSKENMELANLVGDWLKNEVAPVCGEYDEKNEFPEKLYEQMTELGLNIMCTPEEYGGLDLSAVAQTLIAEQLGRYEVGLGSAVGANASATHLMNQFGSPEQKKIFFDILVNGGWAAFCLTEPNAGCDAGAGKTTAVREGDEYVLNGRKCFITNASVADFFVVTAMTAKDQGTKGISAFLVYKGTPGLSVGNHENKMGIRCSTTSDVILEDVRIPAENRLGEEGTGFITAMKTLDLARTWCAVIGVGVAQRCIDEAVAYSKQRVQFGKPICKNQAIQFKIADMEIRTEASRQLIAHSIRLADMGLPFSKESAAAKCFAGDSVMQTAIDAVQILGGYGYSREYPVEKLMRDAKIFQIFEGTNEIQRMVVGRAVIGK